MYPSTDQTVSDFMKASRKHRAKIKKNPEEAKAFLLRAGILAVSRESPTGVVLAEPYRTER